MTNRKPILRLAFSRDAKRFDPGDWLAEFEGRGGWHVVTDANVHLGWAVGENAGGERRCREMLAALSDAERTTLRAHLRDRAGSAAA